MVDPQVIIKANYNRTLLTIRVTAINSPDWVNIVGTRIELFRNSNFSNRFYQNSTTHYKVRAYLENETPDRTIYGKITLTKDDNSTHESTFSFVVPFPILGTVKNENGTKYITSMRKMDKNGNLSPRKYTNKAIINEPPHIDIMADAAGGMLVGNQWATPMLVQNITQGGTRYEVSANNIATIQVVQGDIVRVSESSPNVTFREFASNTNPLCAGVSAHIVSMPAMDKFTYTTQGISVKPYFFYAFNQNGTLTSLPEGSFDIRKIYGTHNGAASRSFFANFNYHGALTSLPEGSFDTTAIKGSAYDYGILGWGGFSNFNAYGALTSLPEGSFDFDNLQYGHMNAFSGFNQNGALTTLPEGSFGFSSFVEYSNSVYYPNFSSFNQSGLLTSLPEGSFHFKQGLTYLGSFKSFNRSGSLTSLPEYSLNFLIACTGSAFSDFNRSGALTSLPEGSFKFSPSWNGAGSQAFSGFNQDGALISLPEDSFNTDSFTQLSQYAFQNFNLRGALTSLPESSFNFDNITTVYEYCLSGFNDRGALRFLPKGSFGFGNLTSISGQRFLYTFNQGGMLERLPVGAFSISSVTTISNEGLWFYSFNSPYDGVGGLLTKSDTDYNPEFVYLTSSTGGTIYADYYDESTQTHYQESVAKNNPFKYWEADYFSVSYTPSQAYTTDLASEYLSSKTITFSASSIDPEYKVTPTITTDGGVDVPVTDNGDGTFTFVMPKDEITVTFAVSLLPAVITLVAEETGTMKVLNKWGSPVIVENATQGTSTTVPSLDYINISVDLDDEITITESVTGSSFRQWSFNSNQTTGLATGVLCRISKMPSMKRFTTDTNGTNLVTYSFYRFCQADNNNKGITSLPAGSFDTSMISTCGGEVFGYFNQNGLLTSLPAGSFKFTNLTQVADWFCQYFNANGALTSLPAGSFNLDNLVTMYNSGHFRYFNSGGALTSLPAGSFSFNNLSNIQQRDFMNFNQNGELTTLPTGSFNLNNVTSWRTDWVFQNFNSGGKLVKDTTQGNYNPNMINGSTANISVDYYGGTTETVAPGNPFYFKTG